jgi:hypothetical protein
MQEEALDFLSSTLHAKQSDPPGKAAAGTLDFQTTFSPRGTS